jgi:hypothetical protein
MPKTKPTPELPSNDLILAAIERAVCHRGRDEPESLSDIKEHLGLPHNGWTTQQLRPKLEELEAAGLIEQSRIRSRPRVGAHAQGTQTAGCRPWRADAARGRPAPQMARSPNRRQRANHRTPRRHARRTRRGHSSTRSRARVRLSHLVQARRAPQRPMPASRFSHLHPARVAGAGRLKPRHRQATVQPARQTLHARLGPRLNVAHRHLCDMKYVSERQFASPRDLRCSELPRQSESDTVPPIRVAHDQGGRRSVSLVKDEGSNLRIGEGLCGACLGYLSRRRSSVLGSRRALPSLLRRRPKPTLAISLGFSPP